MKIHTMAVALSGLLLMALPSFAQITTLEGIVTGMDGNPVQGAVIQIARVDIKTKKPYNVKTDKKGHYIYNLLMGTYDVKCLIDDVEKDHINGVKTSPTASKIVNFDLKAAADNAAAIQKAAKAGGGISKDQERSMTPEQRKALEEYVKRRCYGLAQLVLLSFADSDQHDVDYADGAKGQCDHADRTQEHIHHIEDGIDHLRFLDRVPLVKGVLIVGIEAMIAADDLMNLVLRDHMLGCAAGLILDERDGVLVVFSFDREVGGHHWKRNIAAHIQPDVVAAAEVRHGPDDFEANAVQEYECAQGGTSRKQRLQQFVSEDDHIPPLRGVHLIQPPSVFNGEVADLVQLRFGT